MAGAGRWLWLSAAQEFDIITKVMTGFFVIDAAWTFKLRSKHASKHRLLIAREFRVLFRACPKAIAPQAQ